MCRRQHGRGDTLIPGTDGAKADRDRARYGPADRVFAFAIQRAAGSGTPLAIIGSLRLATGPGFDTLNATAGRGPAGPSPVAVS